MRLRNIKAHTRPAWLFAVMLLGWSLSGRTQGPAPETAPPLFPGGGLVSYNSSFFTRGLTPQLSLLTARPTFSHESDFNFTWGFHPDLDLAVVVPVVTNHFNAAPISLQGTGLGDAMVLVKYRFFRRDSQRGTTQASVTAGPKLPTGQTGLTDGTGNRLPAGLQPGSGSTDFFIAANWTYTGLFNLRRLVADEDFHSLLRSTGTQATNLGSDVESRFWLSYRPYEAKDGSREWFVGPVLTWLYSRDETRCRNYTARQRDECAAGRSNHIRWPSPRNARLVRHGLGRCAFDGTNVNADTASCEFWRYTTIQNAPLTGRRRNNVEKTGSCCSCLQLLPWPRRRSST